MTAANSAPRGSEGIAEAVRASFALLASNTAFVNWLAAETRVSDSDIVAVNNSFVYRDGVATNKSPTYLCLHLGELRVCVPPPFNADFKRFIEKSTNRPQLTTLAEAIQSQRSRLGKLVFILIGIIDESVTASVPIEHSLFKVLAFNPDASNPVALADDVITIRALIDSEQVWSTVEELARGSGIVADSLPENLEGSFAAAFEHLRVEAHSLLHLPIESAEVAQRDTLLGRIAESLDEQIDTYNAALAICHGDPTVDRQSFSELLRVAYNFASDATRLIQLLVSVCDLKPLLMWCTLPQHLALAESFRSLPWIKSKQKASLGLYRETIAGARNHAFHDLFSFDRSLEVDVGGITLAARRLQLFPPYTGKRLSKGFEYEDQELVDALSSFTRAPEAAVSPAFWERNVAVMNALADLLRATIASLQLLHAPD